MVFYEGRVSETHYFTLVCKHNLLFYNVFLTLELLNHCVFRCSVSFLPYFYVFLRRELSFKMTSKVPLGAQNQKMSKVNHFLYWKWSFFGGLIFSDFPGSRKLTPRS